MSTKVGAGLSTETDPRAAAVGAALEARAGLGDDRASVAIVFASPHYADAADAIVDAVQEAVGPAALIGCVAEAVVAGGSEVERSPSIAVWLAALREPVEAFALDFGEGTFEGWPETATGAWIVLADPFSFPADLFLEQVNRTRPGVAVTGGLASGGMGPGQTRLFIDKQVVTGGAVGVTIGDAAEVVTFVSQGCRPIGAPLTVTRARENLIVELGGRPPVERIRELFATLEERDRRLVSQGLLVGRVIDEHKSSFERGDFLVRGLVGADPDTGSIAVGDRVAVGETVQFHVRDAASADEDLRATLASAQRALAGRAACGGLLFTCNGRGSRLFGVADHDAGLVAEELGGIPLAGFFCAGEIGPVGERNFLHGFTASLALIVRD
jgi:small ligand-binding sensory domain FIST